MLEEKCIVVIGKIGRIAGIFLKSTLACTSFYTLTCTLYIFLYIYTYVAASDILISLRIIVYIVKINVVFSDNRYASICARLSYL